MPQVFSVGHFVVSGTVALAISGVSSLASAAPPTIYNLGILSSDSQTYATSVNASGQVAGASGNMAYLYNGTPGSGGTMYNLGKLGKAGSGTDATAINASGQLTGSSMLSNGIFHAFRYVGIPGSGGVMQNLGALGTGYSRGNGINASGQVVGESRVADTMPGLFHAFLHTGTPGAGGTMADLGTLGGLTSSASAINTSGQVVGWATDTPGNTKAFIYTGTPGAGGRMYDLGTPGQSTATAINDAGQVVGWSTIQHSQAFRYVGTPGGSGVVQKLGRSGSYAYGIDSFGNVVGDHVVSDGFLSVHAFLYKGTPGIDGRMMDLNTWLDVNNPVEGAKWSLERAYSINDNGWIAGYGQYRDGTGGGMRAFLLDASSLISSTLTCDFNFDHVVDQLDLNILNSNWHETDALFADGDVNGDCVIDQFDLNAVNANWQHSEAPPALTLIPEPAGLAILGIAIIAATRRQRTGLK